MMKLLGTFLFAAALCCAGPNGGTKVELGDLNGAKFRIDVPDNWNGSLVIYCHGYAPDPGKYNDTKLPPVFAVFTDQGFALAQSGYAAGGWAIQEAATDTEVLRRYFIGKYGKPKETYITGHSMGGFLTMMLMEQYPATYDAGLALCGPLAPSNYFMARGAFDLRVVFDYYFPGALPGPVTFPADFKNSPALTKQIAALLDGEPSKAAILRTMSTVHTNSDLASTVTFITYMLKELQHRASGNAFDNRDVVYEIPENYNAVNQGVKRYIADPRAAEYVRTWYTPTGKLQHPMLAVHTTYDPLVPVRIPNMYPGIADAAGSRNMFAQQFVEHDGHCRIEAPEVDKAFAELRQWKSTGTRPVSKMPQ